MSERKKLILTGILLTNVVLMFLPWFGKGELCVLGVEVLFNPGVVLGTVGFMLGLWWLRRWQRSAVLAGAVLVLAGELYAFFFWPDTVVTLMRPDLAFSLSFTRTGFYLGMAATLALLGVTLAWRKGWSGEQRRQTADKTQGEAHA